MASRAAEVKLRRGGVAPLALGWGLVVASFVLLGVAISQVLNVQFGTTPSNQGTVLLLTALGVVLGVFGIGRIADRTRGLTPALVTFVFSLLAVEALLRAYAVPPGLIPTPSRVWTALVNGLEVLARDAAVTFVQEALVGYLGGTIVAILVALAVVRFRFLERGLLPYAAVASSVPIVALAPVIVKAFGLEPVSKAIIVGITVFFPIVVNVVRGLQSANPHHLDLMRTYAVPPARTFLLVRVPSALPFLFTALKIATTLAMIGAIVGEFFGATGEGLGFRIQIEAGRFNLDVVWAAIVVASVLGIAFYGLVSWLESRFTFRFGSAK
ncbi:ABC transporter permease [Deinococcus yavapaiensis]|uniref:NitT/TauT family transport system permease protein n=1 Tax=Deinococcus yavapaiensis KR-236 TaxID=694435 RepID=A0A318SA09_9DEIO|nr:ABC transporter permease [Deinococcus yavapaiensis]PYE55980.1 NitT/TauT family transport system permease protein [Deinococcus yavapaiensis KR-236]